MTATAASPSGSVTVHVDPTALAAFLRDGNGPVFHMMVRAGDKVKERAKELVGVYDPPPAGPPRDRRPGTLRDSIVKRIVMDNGLPCVEVGSDDPIALWHHEGTQAHPITGNPLLVFYWPKVGAVVATPRVNHPGTKPNRFLVDALAVLATL